MKLAGICPSVGTGIRCGLKIRCEKSRVGSIPTLGTIGTRYRTIARNAGVSQSLNTPEDCADVLKRYMAPRNYGLMVVKVCGNQLTHYGGDELGPDGDHIVRNEP